MKKLFSFGFALFLFGCSTAGNTSVAPNSLNRGGKKPPAQSQSSPPKQGVKSQEAPQWIQVVSIQGKVTATSSNQSRELKVKDWLLLGDLVKTFPSASIQLVLHQTSGP